MPSLTKTNFKKLPQLQSPPPKDRQPEVRESYVPQDTFETSPPERISLGRAALAGLSLLGLMVSGPPAPQSEANFAAWPAGELEGVSLSSLSAEYKVATSEQMNQAVDWALDRSYQKTPNKIGENRHELRQRVQAQDPTSQSERKSDTVHYSGADVVVIALEGTGSFHARKAPVIQEAAARLRAQGLRVDGQQGSLSVKVNDALQAKEGRDPGWSGLSRGLLEGLVRSPDLSENVQWLSFPSEELEILRSLEAFKDPNFPKLVKDAYKSHRGETPGIEGALQAMRDILIQAQAQGNNPKFVLASHSSGGRSLVKLLEKAKGMKTESGENLRFPTVLTIDPVREAHEALFEGGRELLNKGTEHNLNWIRRAVNLPEKKVWPPLVRHRAQRESLYAPSNVDRFFNVFQREDTEGLKIRPHVGIRGSLVEGATNLEVQDVGSGGHGDIAVHDKVGKLFLGELRALLK